MRSSRWIRAASTAALAVLALVTAPAVAQIGELAGFTDAMRREYLNRDLVIIADSLELDESQRDILQNLYQDYQVSFDEGLANMQQRLKDMKEELRTGDQRRILAMIFVPFEEWGSERQKLGDDFLQSIQLILNQRQGELWPGFVRRLMREKTLSRGVLSGESLNLFHVVNELQLPNPIEQSLQPVLAEYDVTLHEALMTRNNQLRQAQSRMVRALQEQDASLSISLIDRQLNARVRVREVNDHYTDVITGSLPADYSDRFRRSAVERAYPKAYRRSAAERMYEAAIGLEDLDDVTRQTIIDLNDVFQGELDLYRMQMIELLRSHEPKQARNRVEIFAARMQGEQATRIADPTAAEQRRRNELDDQYIRLLQGLLTHEQFLQLPGAERWLNRSKVARQKVDQTREQKREAIEQRRSRYLRDKSRGVKNDPNALTRPEAEGRDGSKD